MSSEMFSNKMKRIRFERMLECFKDVKESSFKTFLKNCLDHAKKAISLSSHISTRTMLGRGIQISEECLSS